MSAFVVYGLISTVSHLLFQPMRTQVVMWAS